MRFVFLSAVLIGFCIAAALTHKPSYGGAEPNTNRARAENSQGAESTGGSDSNAQDSGQAASVAASASGGAEQSGAAPVSASAQSPAPTTPAPVKAPWFLDTIKGEPKDLRNYPNSRRVSFSYGPMQGHDTISLVLSSADSMDKITAFYEKEIKLNKWTVDDKTLDPEFSEWLLKKGDDQSAKVQVKKQPGKESFIIVVARVGKQDAAKAND